MSNEQFLVYTGRCLLASSYIFGFAVSLPDRLAEYVQNPVATTWPGVTVVYVWYNNKCLVPVTTTLSYHKFH